MKETKTRINTYAEDTLINLYTDQFNNNQILHFISFKVILKMMDLKNYKEKKYHIIFNFEHYRKLYEIQKYSSKILFIIKFLEINSELNMLSFNFREFNNFDIPTWMENIKKFSKESIKKRTLNEDLYKEFDIFSKRIKIEFVYPRWSIIAIEEKKEIMKTFEIKSEVESDFMKCFDNLSSESWTNFLNKCLNRAVAPKPVLPESSNKKTRKKTIMRFSKSQKRYKLIKVSNLI